MKEKYPTLRLLSVILKVMAWIVGISSFIVFFIVAFGGTVAGKSGAWGAGGILFVGIEYFILSYAGAEIITILLAIEKNTRGPEQS